MRFWERDPANGPGPKIWENGLRFFLAFSNPYFCGKEGIFFRKFFSQKISHWPSTFFGYPQPLGVCAIVPGDCNHSNGTAEPARWRHKPLHCQRCRFRFDAIPAHCTLCWHIEHAKFRNYEMKKWIIFRFFSCCDFGGTKIGVVCQNAKRFFFGFWWFCCLLPVFSCLCFVKKAQKGYFSAIQRFFVYFVPPKGLSLKSFFSSYSVFFSGFPFVFPFKTPFYPSAFWPSAPFWKTLVFLVSLFFFFLPFPFLMFACFFKQTFLTSHFWNPSCFHFGGLFISSVVFVFVLIFHVSAFLFWCWLCFWYVLFCYCLVLVVFLVLLSQTMKKHCFPCNSSVLVMLVTRSFYIFFAVSCFWSCFFFLVLFVSILDIWFVLCCVCVVWFSLKKKE